MDVMQGDAVPGCARLMLRIAVTGPGIGIGIVTGSFRPWAGLSPKADGRL